MTSAIECLLPIRSQHADIGTMEQRALELISGLFARQDDSPFFIKDAALHYIAANPAMARLCGARNPEAMLGKRAAAFFPALEAHRYELLDTTVIEKGVTLTDKLKLATGRGVNAWLLFSRLPVRDPSGKIIGVAASARRLAHTDRSKPSVARAAAAAEELELRFDRPLDLTVLAQRCSISASQLERDFRCVFGVGPQRYLHKLRIERALQLLIGPDSIAAIAQTCGFSDQSAFTRRFRDVTGLTPTDWRRRNRPGVLT